jgi:hypothetical protein
MYLGKTVHSPGGTIEVAILVDGEEQPLFSRPWDGKIFVIAKPGRAFELRVRNLTTDHIQVISTVDGQNTFDDQPGDLHYGQGVIMSVEHTVTSWRRTQLFDKRLMFRTLDHRYEPRDPGPKDNIGVIGFAVYREQPLTVIGVNQSLTGFSRDGNDPDVLVIGYDTLEFLSQQGVVMPAEPNPFPGIQASDSEQDLPPVA